MVSGGSEIQTENGFVKIHPAILELLATRQLSGREFRCLLFLFRKTYGYQKKNDNISLSQWEQGTGIPRTRVGDVLDSLVTQNLIFKIDNGTKRPATWGFNKHFETWQDGQSVTLEGDSLQTQENESVTPMGDSSVTLEGDSSKPSVTLQGDKSVTLQGDNNRKKERETTGEKPFEYFGLPRPKRREQVIADGYTQDAAKAGVGVESYRGIVDALLDAAGLRALVEDGGDDASLNYAKRDALSIIRMGVVTVDMARAAIEACKAANNWREDYQPRSSDIAKYVSQLKQKGKPLPAAPSPTTNGVVSGFDFSTMIGG